MQKRKLIFNLTLSALIGASCAPKPHQLQLSNPPQDFQAKVQDVDLKSQGIFSFDFDQTVVVPGKIEPSMIYRLSENMMTLGSLQNAQTVSPQASPLSVNGEKILNRLLDLPQLATTTSIEQSPFTQLAISETQSEVEQALAEVNKSIKISVEQLDQVLMTLGKAYAWPQGPQPIDQVGRAIWGFLQVFLERADHLDIYDALKTQMKAEIMKQQKWLVDLSTQINQELNTVQTFPELMTYVQKLLQDQQVTPPDSIKQSLQQGGLLGQDLAACDSDQAVLTTIIDIWKMLGAQEREQYIKPQSESLYNYLKKSSDGDLKCLRSSSCGNPIKALIKDLVILPKIKKMGIQKVCSMIDQNALSYVKTLLQSQAQQIYAQIPGYISETLHSSITEKMKFFNQIQQDYGGFLKKQMQSWAAGALMRKGQIRGIDAGNLKLSLKNKELQFELDGTAADQNIRVSSTATFGSSMSALTRYFADLTADAGRVEQFSLDLINQLVALGGYTDATGKMTPALLTPLENPATYLDLTHLTSSSAIYGLPDQFVVGGNFSPRDPRPAKFSLSAKSQAELIRGLSKVIGYLRDWKVSAYDHTLGSVTAAMLAPDYKDISELQRAMFPKAELMTLAIGDLAVTLENLTKKMAQVYVVGLHDNKIMWVNDYDLAKGDLVAMAGVSDIVNGVRSAITRSQDLSRWILALSEFIKNTEGIENTQSDILLDKDANGASSLDALVKARRQLKMLTVALANMLSHQMVDKDGLVVSELKLASLAKTDVEKSLLDQALAIQALSRAAEATGVRIYRISATEIYYNLNAKKYLPKMHFYSLSGRDDKMDLQTLTEMAVAISELKPFLPPKSQEQAAWLLEPWLKGLSQLH